jgi:DNA modification methylase
MQLHVFNVEDISVPKNRQRKFFDEEQIQQLAASIADNGLIHPIVVRKEEDGEITLVAGERRLKALDIVWGFGQEVRCGTKIIPERHVPCLFLGDIDKTDAFEIELEENIRRTDLDWREKAVAVSQLYELRRLQAERNGDDTPTVADIAREVSGSADGQFHENVRQDIILARNLDNPVVAKAASRKEAFKALKRDEEVKRNAELGRKIGETFNSSVHQLIQGECLDVMARLEPGTFDVILTDPPYGISADEYGDSGGRTGGEHRYDDSPESWFKLMGPAVDAMARLAKPAAHAYIFCDIDMFHHLRGMMEGSGWECFRTPLIWVNPSAMRTPWPEHGPQRKWQMILFAIKGKRRVNQIYPDVINVPSDPNLGHQAQKPVALYSDLLRRSVRPGDSVLDPFCGTGTIYPACHEFKCKGTGIERDAAACGIASQRLKELK